MSLPCDPLLNHEPEVVGAARIYFATRDGSLDEDSWRLEPAVQLKVKTDVRIRLRRRRIDCLFAWWCFSYRKAPDATVLVAKHCIPVRALPVMTFSIDEARFTT